MAGLAAIEIAQKVSYTWRTMKENGDDQFQSRDAPQKSGRKHKKKSGSGKLSNKG